jgi:hypothetical protein
VDQKKVDHACHCVGPIHSRGAILENVHVIDHREWYQVNVHARAVSGSDQGAKGDTFTIYED